MQGLHQVDRMAARLVCKVEALQQAPCHWQQARLLHVIMQQPAGFVRFLPASLATITAQGRVLLVRAVCAQPRTKA